MQDEGREKELSTARALVDEYRAAEWWPGIDYGERCKSEGGDYFWGKDGESVTDANAIAAIGWAIETRLYEDGLRCIYSPERDQPKRWYVDDGRQSRHWYTVGETRFLALAAALAAAGKEGKQ